MMLERTITLTLSATPLPIKKKMERKILVERAKPIMHIPKTETVAMSERQLGLMKAVWVWETAMIKEPRAGAARSHPSPVGPTCKSSVKIGKSATAHKR